MTYDPVTAVAVQAASPARVMNVAKVQLLVGGSVRKVHLLVNIAGTGLVAGPCQIGVYDSSGALIGQSDDLASLFGMAADKVITLAAPTVPQKPPVLRCLSRSSGMGRLHRGSGVSTGLHDQHRHHRRRKI